MKALNGRRFTPEYDEDGQFYTVVDRDATGMPVDQRGQYPTMKQASRAASNLNYETKMGKRVTVRLP
jgi:hypothetical protein